jgi:hypothetical protein
MQKSSFMLLAILLAMTAARPVRADSASDAMAVIERAIDAAGGAKNLMRHNALTWKEKGTFHGQGEAMPYRGSFAVQWPDRLRMEIEGVFTIVLNGDRGWVRTQGTTREMTRDELAEEKHQHYGNWVTTLLPLKDKSFKLEFVGEREVGGKPAIEIKVIREGQREVRLFFDQQTGLLAKSSYLVKADNLGGKVVEQATTFQDYREVEGVQVPRNVTMYREGKLFVAAENEELKAAGKLEAGVFERP